MQKKCQVPLLVNVTLGYSFGMTQMSVRIAFVLTTWLGALACIEIPQDTVDPPSQPEEDRMDKHVYKTTPSGGPSRRPHHV